MMTGASTMFDMLEELAKDLKEQGYEEEIRLEFSKCMQYCKGDASLTPVVKINEEIVTKAKTQSVMEKIVALVTDK